MTTATLPAPLAAPQSPAWHELRSTGIGASEAAAAVGRSRWDTPLSLYLMKRGELAAVEETDAMRLGTALEPVVVSEFAHRTGVPIAQYPMGLFRHPDHAFMLATPDALLASNELLECKTSTYRIAPHLGDDGSDGIPDEPLLQAQQQMAVVGLAVCHVAFLIDGRALRTFRVERNETIIDALIDAERELWERIVAGDPPEPNWEHESTPDLVRELYGDVADDRIVRLSPEAAAAWIEQEQLGRQATEIEKRRKALKARTQFELGEAAAGVLPGDEYMIRRKRIVAEVEAHTKDYIDCRKVKATRADIMRAVDVPRPIPTEV